jgi:hypothetical protein
MSDDSFYAMVAEEISSGAIDRTTWTKAFAHSGGSEEVAKSLYIRFRVEQLREQSRRSAEEFNRQQQTAVVERRRRVLAGKSVNCPSCGCHITAIRESSGSVWRFLFLLLLGILPGVVYALTVSGFRFRCPKCHFELCRVRA